MAFEKISREEWLKLTKEEQEGLRLEFDKSVESRRRVIAFTTRAIALLCVLALFYIGYVQLEQAKGFSKIMEEKGNLGYCYLCGKEAMRQCDCVYPELNYDKEKLSNDLAEYNIDKCPTKITPFSQQLDIKLINLTELIVK